jgi:hypothetical protein
MELTIEKRVQASGGQIHQKAKKEAEESLGLKVLEKEATIASMQEKIEELKKKAEQCSQQLQGEVLELELEGILRQPFPRDVIEPVPWVNSAGPAGPSSGSPSGQKNGATAGFQTAG